MGCSSMAEQTYSIAKLMEGSGVAFGTSGARGPVAAMTDRICFAYVLAFLRHAARQGEFGAGRPVALAGDLRPSTPRILAACAAAVQSLGGTPRFCGFVPSPAVALYAFANAMPSMMVTGSHIPDDRNGIKFNRAATELLKPDEAAMRTDFVTLDDALFDAEGMLRHAFPLGDPVDVESAYVERYLAFFGADALKGMKLGLYQHSAVGRDILLRLLEALGAQVTPFGRSDRFIPVDTEAVREEDRALARQAAREHGFDAILSTDGDSDRPLLADEQGEWLRGDVLGILCARAIGATHVVTPVSSNSALEKSGWFSETVRTRIGSPFVIEAMDAVRAEGRIACGYEANGGFLLGTDIMNAAGRTLGRLPTRDAVLPMLATLVLAREAGMSLRALVATLPPRYTYSDRLKAFPSETSRQRLDQLRQGSVRDQLARLSAMFEGISGTAVDINDVDGLRTSFANEEVVHLRPSGNAPELRCYTEADTPERAHEMAEATLALLEGWR